MPISKKITDCKTCDFYYGKNRLNCAPHPYGSEQDFCPDWQPKHLEKIVMNDFIVNKIKKLSIED